MTDKMSPGEKIYRKQLEKITDAFENKNPIADPHIIFEKDVLETEAFKRHIKETALKMDISEELTRTVIEHHLRYLFDSMTFTPKRKRILLYGFFKIDMSNLLINRYSKYSRTMSKKILKQFSKSKKS